MVVREAGADWERGTSWERGLPAREGSDVVAGWQPALPGSVAGWQPALPGAAAFWGADISTARRP